MLVFRVSWSISEVAFLIAKLLFDDPQRMLNLGAEMSFGRLNQLTNRNWRVRVLSPVSH